MAASFKGLPTPYTVPAHREAFVPVFSLWGAPDLAKFCLLLRFFTRQFYLESLFLLAGEGQARGDILVLLLEPSLPLGSEELQIEDFLVKV